jgi:hypothetical protein
MGADVRALISGAMVKAEAAVEATDKLAEALACAQDSEESEAAGVLRGYAEAFRAVYNLLVYDDPKDITGMIESLKTEAEQAKLEREEFLSEDVPEGATVVVVYGASAALLKEMLDGEQQREYGLPNIDRRED